MSGIRVGTRLEQLRKLAAQVAQEIKLEERKLLEVATAKRAPKKVRRPQDHNSVDAHLLALGVTAREVKAWAVSVGLVDRVQRGRVGARLVGAYDVAHQDEEVAS